MTITRYLTRKSSQTSVINTKHTLQLMKKSLSQQKTQHWEPRKQTKLLVWNWPTVGQSELHLIEKFRLVSQSLVNACSPTSALLSAPRDVRSRSRVVWWWVHGVVKMELENNLILGELWITEGFFFARCQDGRVAGLSFIWDLILCLSLVYNNWFLMV